MDLLDLFVTILLSVLLDGNFLFFAQSSGPQLNFSELFLLLFFDLLTLLLEDALVEINDGVVLYLFLVLLEILDLLLADLLETFDCKDIQNFERLGLALVLEEFEEDITFAALGIANLLLFLLPELARGISLALTLLLELLFRLLVSQLLLNLEHVLLLLLHLGRLLVELLLDLLEHSQSLGPATACCLNYSLEHGLELRTKGEEVLGNLCLWVEGHGSLSFTRVEIDGGVDKSLTVALVEQSLDLRG